MQRLGGGAWREPCALRGFGGLVGHLEEGRGRKRFLVPSDLPELPGSLTLFSVPTEDRPEVLGVTGSLVPSLASQPGQWCCGADVKYKVFFVSQNHGPSSWATNSASVH